MTTSLRERRHPGWLFRQLNQGRFILRLFLLGLLLLLFLGFAGALQSGLSPIGAGQTELVYTVASFRNGASLNPIQKVTRYSFATTADANMQNYFSLDPDTGVLTLRDGLRSLSFQRNPLSSFPYQIVTTEPGKTTRQVVSLYIQFLNCKAFLAKHPASEGTNLPPSDADAVLQCIQIDPVIPEASTLKQVRAWIQDNAKANGLLPTQTQRYLSDAQDVLSLPMATPKAPPILRHQWGPGSPNAARGETPVLRLNVLQDKALPGLQIFSVADAAPDPAALPAKQATTTRPGAPESAWGSLLRSLDKIFLVILQLRYPVLIGVGILWPLLAWMMRRPDAVVRRCLEPYLLLILAQVMTLLLAEALMGEGLVVWVGFIYTLLRVMQLLGLLWMSSAEDQRLRRLFNLHSRPWLRNLVRTELVLWCINALGLGWHIVGVFQTFPLISPS
jgi:hypothetical protein